MKINDLSEQKEKKKKPKIIITIASCLIVLLTVSLCVAFIPDWTSDEEYLKRMGKAIENDVTSFPITVESSIAISEGEKIVGILTAEYIIESETKGYYKKIEEYPNAPELYETQEYCFDGSKIFIYKTDESGSLTNEYSATLGKFQEVILGDEIKKNALKIDKSCFDRFSVKRGDTIKLEAKVSEEKSFDFMQKQTDSAKLKIEITKGGKLKAYELCYREGAITTLIKRTVKYSAEFNQPEWIKTKDSFPSVATALILGIIRAV